MIDAKEILKPELIEQIEETARTQNRGPSEVLEDAWHRYAEEQSWIQLIETGKENARRRGIKESDVDRLIAEYRAEQQSR